MLSQALTSFLNAYKCLMRNYIIIYFHTVVKRHTGELAVCTDSGKTICPDRTAERKKIVHGSLDIFIKIRYNKNSRF